MRQADVPVTSTRYDGMIHDFVMLDVLSETAAAREAIKQANDAVKTVFFRQS